MRRARATVGSYDRCAIAGCSARESRFKPGDDRPDMVRSDRALPSVRECRRAGVRGLRKKTRAINVGGRWAADVDRSGFGPWPGLPRTGKPCVLGGLGGTRAGRTDLAVDCRDPGSVSFSPGGRFQQPNPSKASSEQLDPNSRMDAPKLLGVVPDLARWRAIIRRLDIRNPVLWFSQTPKLLITWGLPFFLRFPCSPPLVALAAAFLAFFRQRAALQLEILALRHQLGVLQRSVQRPKLTVVLGNLTLRYDRPGFRVWFSQTPKLLINWGLPFFLRFPCSPPLVALVAAFLAFFRQRAALQLEIPALRHQLGVLQRSVKRPKLTAADRFLWAWLAAVWTDWQPSAIAG